MAYHPHPSEYPIRLQTWHIWPAHPATWPRVCKTMTNSPPRSPSCPIRGHGGRRVYLRRRGGAAVRYQRAPGVPGDAVRLIQAVTKHAEERIRGELLRVYWYDAARDRVPTIDQRVIAQMPWVKLRLGNLNARGQQKGVDAQIRADMEALARHRAITDAVLIAGRRGHGARRRGRPGLRGAGPPVGRRAAVRHQPGGAPGLGVGHGGRARVPTSCGPTSPRTRGARPEVRPGPASRTSPTALPRPSCSASSAPSAGDPDRQAPGPARTPAVPGRSGCTGPMPRLGPDRRGSRRPASTWPRSGSSPGAADNIRDLLPGPILPPVIDKELLVEAEKELGLSLRPYQEATGMAAGRILGAGAPRVRHRPGQVPRLKSFIPNGAA